MDADYDYNKTNEQSEFGGRKRKGKSRFARAVSHKKPVFNPGLFGMVISGSKLYQNLLLDKVFGFKLLFTNLVSRLVTCPFVSILYSIIFPFLSTSAGSLFPVRSQAVSFSFRESLDTNMQTFVYRLNFVKWLVLTWHWVIHSCSVREIQVLRIYLAIPQIQIWPYQSYWKQATMKIIPKHQI